MPQGQDDYLTEYRSLKLTRDDKGVLVAEFHGNGGPFTMGAQAQLKEGIVREVGYGLSLEGASSAALMKSIPPRVNLLLGKENPHENTDGRI